METFDHGEKKSNPVLKTAQSEGALGIRTAPAIRSGRGK